MNKRIIWLVLTLVIATGYFACTSGEDSETQKTESAITSDEHPEAGATSVNNYQPQNTLDNPRQESVDPFMGHPDFDVIFRSVKNKSDFDFSFTEFADKTAKYTLSDGTLDFELKGTLRTSVNLEDNVALNLEFYNNNQVSYTQRRKHSEYLLTYSKEKSKTEPTGKNLYQFDFKNELTLDPGLYYFTIVPKGRNRLLYIGKFEVR